MAQIGDLFARLFGGGTRGLSGDAGRVLLDDPELEYFNARLRRHATSADLVEDPGALWGDGPRRGLGGHLEASDNTENLGFTDVLVVLSSDDWHRTLEQLREPWTQRASQVLGSLLWKHCEAHDLHQLFPQRPFGFRFIEDGGHEMEGARLGLEPGQFVTGLLPNLYTGPVASSYPVIAVLLNIPGAWEGYQEVGRLYSDQVQFTLGTHWLDTYNHPALRVPALYRLQQYADGSFVHIVNPDGRERFRISSNETAEGPAVLTLSGADGAPVGHMVLAIVEDSRANTQSHGEEPAASPATAERPRIKALPPPAAPRQSPLPRPGPGALEPTEFIGTGTRTLSHGGNRTVIPADVDERVLTLRERGALFQKVHFSKFMQGYDVYVGRNGEVGTTIRDPAASFEIRGDTMAMVPHIDSVRVDGHTLRRGERLVLKGRRVVEVAGQRLEFIDQRGVQADGWPYLGELRRTGGASHMVFGGNYRLGRDRRCKVRLPDEPANANIVWLPELGQGVTIRSRNGEIPKSRFYTDSIMVASEHAEINLVSEPVLICTARNCYTFVRRGGDVFALHPAEGRPGSRNMDLQPGDEILIGNCVFAVDYPPADGPRYIPTEPPSSAPVITAGELAQASTSTVPPATMGADLPPAAGLGEAGPTPKPPQFENAGPDSFLGVDPVQAPLYMLPPPAPGRTPKPAAAPAEAEPAEKPSPLDLPDPGVAPPPVAFKTMDTTGSIDLPPVPAPAAEADPADEATVDSLFIEEVSVEEVSVEEEPGEDLPVQDLPVQDTPVAGAAAVQTAAVVEVDEDSWQLELSRPASFALVGWMVTGEAKIANHSDASVVIPENRSTDNQQFRATDYFQLFVRGRRARIACTAPTEATLRTPGGEQQQVEAADGVRMEVVRRGPDGGEDFRVCLELRAARGLPDPRAQLLVLAEEDPMVEALFTRGLPLRRDHDLVLGTVRAHAHFDGEHVVLRDYLESYRRADGSLRPFFVQHQGGTWRTVPEDGSALSLTAGDRLLVDHAMYELR